MEVKKHGNYYIFIKMNKYGKGWYYHLYHDIPGEAFIWSNEFFVGPNIARTAAIGHITLLEDNLIEKYKEWTEPTGGTANRLWLQKDVTNQSSHS